MNKVFSKLYMYFFLLSIITALSCQREVITEYIEPPSKKNNRVVIISNPPKTSIYLNKFNTGFTSPDTLNWLADGTNSITLKHRLYLDTTLTINTSDGSFTKLNVDYFLNPKHFGDLIITSNPEKANVLVNDKSTGRKTPAEFKALIPGEYKIMCSLPMHRSDSVLVTVLGGRLARYYLFLDDTTKGLWFDEVNSKIPTNNIFHVVVDSLNIKWIGTEEEGLVRFDGKNFKVFNKYNSSFNSMIVKSLCVGKRNHLWIGIDNGLYTYDGVSFKNYSQEVKYNSCNGIAQDSKGNFWIATSGGLFKYNGATWEQFTTENSGLSDNNLLSIAIDKNNIVWIGTNDNGLSLFDGNAWRKWDNSNMGLKRNVGKAIYSIACDLNGWMWVANVNYDQDPGGVVTRYDGTKWEIISAPKIDTGYPHTIYVDKNNSKWISAKTGLGRIDKNNFVTNFTKDVIKIQSNKVLACVIDKNGDLYIATVLGGLSKIKKGFY